MIAWLALVTAALVASLLCAVEVGWAKILARSRRRSALKIYENIVLTSWRYAMAAVSVRPAMPLHGAARIIPGFSQTTQGVKGFSDPGFSDILWERLSESRKFSVYKQWWT